MNKRELEQWIAAHNYPKLVLTENDVVRPGRDAWEKLLRDTGDRIDRAIELVEGHIVRLAKEEGVTK